MNNRVKGLVLLAGLVVVIGSLGYLLAGFVWDVHIPRWALMVGAIANLFVVTLSALLVYLAVREPKKEEEGSKPVAPTAA